MITDWQPIATAPKNPAGEMFGPTILIYYDVDGLSWPAYWGPCPDAPAEGIWLPCEDGRPFDTPFVTHWMPLPPAPNAS